MFINVWIAPLGALTVLIAINALFAIRPITMQELSMQLLVYAC